MECPGGIPALEWATLVTWVQFPTYNGGQPPHPKELYSRLASGFFCYLSPLVALRTEDKVDKNLGPAAIFKIGNRQQLNS